MCHGLGDENPYTMLCASQSRLQHQSADEWKHFLCRSIINHHRPITVFTILCRTELGTQTTVHYTTSCSTGRTTLHPPRFICISLCCALSSFRVNSKYLAYPPRPVAASASFIQSPQLVALVAPVQRSAPVRCGVLGKSGDFAFDHAQSAAELYSDLL